MTFDYKVFVNVTIELGPATLAVLGAFVNNPEALKKLEAAVETQAKKSAELQGAIDAQTSHQTSKE